MSMSFAILVIIDILILRGERPAKCVFLSLIDERTFTCTYKVTRHFAMESRPTCGMCEQVQWSFNVGHVSKSMTHFWTFCWTFCTREGVRIQAHVFVSIRIICFIRVLNERPYSDINQWLVPIYNVIAAKFKLFQMYKMVDGRW